MVVERGVDAEIGGAAPGVAAAWDRIAREIARMQLADLILPRLRPPDATPDDERAFAALTADLTGWLGLFGATTMLAATLLWWPLDLVVMPDAAQRAAFAVLRARAVAVEVVTILLLARRTPTTSAAVAMYCAHLVAFGWSLGELAATRPDAALVWLADANVGVLPMAFVPMTLRQRAAATLAAGATLDGAFFLASPGNVGVPGGVGQVSFLLFVVALSILMGEVWHQLTRWLFLQRRALDRAHAALAALTDDLAGQVAERTATLRALARHLDDAQEAERRRIAHDLHDDLGQHLSAMRYTVARLEPQVSGAPAALVEDLGALLDGTAASMRAVVSRLRPRVLDELGLQAAAEWLRDDLAGRGLACTLRVSPGFAARSGRLGPAIELLLFRALQESTTNAVKHAQAARLTLELDADDAGVTVRVTDDGRGFDPRAPRDGFGLLGLTERLADVGGALEVDSAPGRGTQITARAPLRAG